MVATANSIVTPQSPWSSTSVCVSSNTDFDTPTSTVELISQMENLNGLRISGIWAVNRGPISAENNLQIYLFDGFSKLLIDSKCTVSENDPGSSIANSKTFFNYSDESPLFVGPGFGVHVATGFGLVDGIVFFAQGGLY